MSDDGAVWQATTSILARADEKALPGPRERERIKKLPRGYKLRDEGHRPNLKTLLTDEQVLECRRRYEFETGWTLRRLALEYGTSTEYMRHLLDYVVRSKLIPKRPR